MYRAPPVDVPLSEKSPHRRGDVPHPRSGHQSVRGISPQAWGCTGTYTTLYVGYVNLPTGVGMYRWLSTFLFNRVESPHRRGDVPLRLRANTGVYPISPQAWGCTIGVPVNHLVRKNLPTGVGMYRRASAGASTRFKSPHRRGDVPGAAIVAIGEVLISPQAWGCTVSAGESTDNCRNLPTGVGMYRCCRGLCLGLC